MQLFEAAHVLCCGRIEWRLTFIKVLHSLDYLITLDAREESINVTMAI